MIVYIDKITAKRYKIFMELTKYTWLEEIRTGYTFMFDDELLEKYFYKIEDENVLL